jgi:hypothetical protein
MAKRKKSSGTGGLGVALLIFIGLIAMVPKEIWFAIIGIAIVALAIYLYVRHQNAKAAQAAVQRPQPERRPTPVQRDHPAAEPKGRIVKTTDRRMSAVSPRTADEQQPVPIATTPVQVSTAPPAPSRLFKLPESPRNYGPGAWTPPGQNVIVGDAIIPGGMVCDQSDGWRRIGGVRNI